MEARRLILDALEDAPDGMCDGCLRLETQLPSHQDVNGTCRILASIGALSREKDLRQPCPRCNKALIINRLIPGSDRTYSSKKLPRPASPLNFGIVELDALRRILIGWLNEIDPDNARLGFSKRVTLLRNSDRLTGRTAALMLTHATYRNDLYYNDRLGLSESEERILFEIDRELRAFLKDVHIQTDSNIVN